jgi:hypothetical protein
MKRNYFLLQIILQFQSTFFVTYLNVYSKIKIKQFKYFIKINDLIIILNLIYDA